MGFCIFKEEQYGIMLLVSMIKTSENNKITSPKLAKKLGLSRRYVDFVLSKLKKSNLIGSKKGNGGGFFLSRPPEEISLTEIISSIRKVRPDYLEVTQNLLGKTLEELEDSVNAVLLNVSLKTLAEKSQ